MKISQWGIRGAQIQQNPRLPDEQPSNNIHLPAMPLTPTEHRQRDREKNISLVKAGSNSINQFKK